MGSEMIWFLWGVYAAIILALVNSFIRANPLNLSFWPLLLLVTIPTALGTQTGFIFFYQGASSFYGAWFWGTALSSTAGFLATVFIFRECISFMNLIGIGMILGGSWLLTR